MALLKGRYEELRKGTPGNQAWTKSGWTDSMERLLLSAKMFKTSLLTGKHLMNGDLENSKPVILLGSMVEYHPLKTSQDSTSSVRKF